jgi:putative intracellular protease/amidase
MFDGCKFGQRESFGGDDAKRMSTLKFIDSLSGPRHPLKLSYVTPDAKDCVGVFVPGGYAPMVDLAKDPDLGKIVRSFHESGRLTDLVCHGAMAILSKLSNAETFDQALISEIVLLFNRLPLVNLMQGIGEVFSKMEEQQSEAPQLAGRIQYYNDDALVAAGALIKNGALLAVEYLIRTFRTLCKKPQFRLT